jgi:hypothetical protein
MTQPKRTASKMKAMSPPTNGQYMAVNIYEAGRMVPQRSSVERRCSSVERDLLAGRRERPSHLHAPLLPEHEAELARRPQAIRMRRTEGRTGDARIDRAQKILMEEAVFAACLRRCHATIRHT